jgi:hypothetical protein
MHGNDDDPFYLPEVEITADYPKNDNDINWPDNWNDLSDGSDLDVGNDLSDGYNNGDYDWEPDDNNGGSSGGNSDGATPARESHLTAEQKRKLDQIMQEMIDQYCAYKAMLDYTSELGAEFYDIVMDNSISAPAEYSPCTGVLKFRDTESMIYYPEEFIHFFQQNCYPGGICQNDAYRHNNIEFEAKVIYDMITYIAYTQNPQFGFELYGGQGMSSSMYSSYFQWIDALTSGGYYFPSSLFNDPNVTNNTGFGYYDFMQAWATGNGYLIDSSFAPAAFSEIGSCN